jgi:hypothetical protein
LPLLSRREHLATCGGHCVLRSLLETTDQPSAAQIEAGRKKKVDGEANLQYGSRPGRNEATATAVATNDRKKEIDSSGCQL